MQLISFGFALFVVALLCAYYLVGRIAGRYQWVVLLVANFVFYYFAASVGAMVYILVAAGSTWACSQVMGRMSAEFKERRKATKDRKEKKALKAQLQTRKRVVLIIGLAITLGVLGYLKYWNVILFNFGFEPSTNSLGILLPLGISFYTFMSIMYLIDVYNDKYEPEKNFLHYLTFVSYFPSFVQGPINRYDEMAPQMFVTRHADLRGMQRGLLRLGLGLLKKIVVANMLSSNINAIIGSISEETPGAAIAIGVILYSFYMYGDFSGGIDIVEGVSELFGITMSVNFLQPYLSVSISDFWQRWHESLGVFMRDYLFYPIALTSPMKRFSKWAQKHLPKHMARTLPACIANLIVFFFVGLWHGAEWHFIAWGMYNGIVVALADLFQPVFKRMKEALHVNDASKPYHFFTIVRTFIMVNFGRYFDVITSVSIAFLALRNTFFNFAPKGSIVETLANLGVTDANLLGLPIVTILGLVVIFTIDAFEERGTDVRDAILSKKFVVRLAIYVLIGALIFVALPTTVNGDSTFAYANY